MAWAVRESLTEAEISSGKRYVIGDAIATQAMVGLTTGAFLVAFALELGASNAMIGFLAAILPLTQLVQIPAVHLVETTRVRRAVSFYGCLVSRSAFLLIGLSPLVLPAHLALPALVAGLILYGVFAGVCTCAWNSWMRDLIPVGELGGFNAKRLALASSAGMLVTLAAGYYVDWFAHSVLHPLHWAYCSLFFLAFLISLIDLYFIASIPEPRMRANGAGIFKLILAPLRNRNFRNLLRFLFSWNIAVNLAAPFFTVYMLKRLELNVLSVIALGVVSQVMNLMFFRIWGRITDRFSNKAVLRVCAPIFIVCLFLWTLTSLPERHALTVPLLIALHVFMGVATSGTTLGAFNIAMKLAPREAATAYLAAAGLVNSLAAGLAPVAGGYFADYFAARKLAFSVKWTSPGTEISFQTLHFSHWDFFFVMASLLGCLALFFLRRVTEEGEVENRVIMNELFFNARRWMRNLSTIGGIRWMVELPYAMVRHRSNRHGQKEK